MLLVIIPAVWLSIALLVIVACRAAARGDRALAVQSRALTPDRDHVTVHQRTRWQQASPREEVRIGGGSSLPRKRPAVRGTRCATGS